MRKFAQKLPWADRARHPCTACTSGCSEPLRKRVNHKSRPKSTTLASQQQGEDAAPHVVLHGDSCCRQCRSRQHPTPAKLMASVSSTAHPVLTPGCAGSSPFFPVGKSEKTPLISVSSRSCRRRCGALDWLKILTTSTWIGKLGDLLRKRC